MITVKEEFLASSKTRRAVRLGGHETITLWVAMKVYSASQLTNGFVPDDELEELAPALLKPSSVRRALKALVECGHTRQDGTKGAGLVEEAPNGWQLHDYLEHEDSAERILERRALAKARKQRHESRNATGTRSGTGSERDQERDPERVPNAPRARGRADVSPLLSSPHPPSGEGENTTPTPKRGRRQARPTQRPCVPLPADWVPTPEHTETAKRLGVDLELEVRKFRARAERDGLTYVSWNGAFSTWLAHAEQFKRERESAQGSLGLGNSKPQTESFVSAGDT